MDTIERILVLVLVLLIIIGRTERTRRWWLALLLHTHTNSDPFEFKRREKSLSLFGRRDFKRETKFKPEKKNESCSNARALSLSLSLSLLPSRNQWKTRSKKRPRRTRHKSALRKNTKGMMHHRSSRLKRERQKKNRMNCSKTQTHNFKGRPSFNVSLFRDRRRPERRDGDRDQRGRVVVFVAVGSRAQIRRCWLRRRSSSRC